MFELLSSKSKLALCVAGAFIGAALCVYGLIAPPAPIDLRFILHPLAYLTLTANLIIASIAMLLSLGVLIFDIVESRINNGYRW